MDKLSVLLQEAKPLYFKRKRARALTAKCLMVVVPIVIATFAILPFSLNNSPSEISYYNTSTSVIEQMGFPTDDYGLLKVD